MNGTRQAVQLPADRRSALVQGRGHLSASRQVLLRRQQRRHRRFPGPAAEARLHRRARRQRDLAAAVLSVAARATTATTSPTTATSIPNYGTLARRPAVRRRRRTRAACGSSPNWSSTTPPTSIPGSSARAQRQAGLRMRATSTSGPTPTRSTPDTRIIFIDTEKSNWTWDPVAGAYFWHRFYSHQPDLNFDNPRVLRGSAERHALLARHRASTGCGSTPCPTWSSARAPTTRTCRRRTRS